MNTRNPLDRIYSAWSDKFILKPSVLLKSSLIQTLEQTYQSPCHSEPLMNKMRMAHYIRESKIIKHHVQKINYKYESPSTRQTKKSPCELVSFPAFLNYILDDIAPSSPNLPRGNVNAHWEPIYKICQPCHIKYHLLTTLETADKDAEKVGGLLNFEDPTFPQVNNSTVKDGKLDGLKFFEIAKKYSRWGISDRIFKRFYDKYMLDFELFGYDFERFLMAYRRLRKKDK